MSEDKIKKETDLIFTDKVGKDKNSLCGRW